MRISEEEIGAIVNSVLRFDQGAEIYLFGSRVDDAKKGGDIDILVKSNVLNQGMLHLVEDEIFRHIEEQKIDFVLTPKDHLSTFASLVLSQGAVKLCPTTK